MGMAASQARLLTITARMHDVEYQAQSIQNAKIQLSTQSDEVYQKYLEALDDTTLTIKDDNGNTVTANFNNLCGINSVNTSHHYAILDDHDRLVVPDDVASSYKTFKEKGGSDAYAFAIWMLSSDPDATPENVISRLQGVEDSVAEGTSNLAGTRENLNKIAEEALGDDKEVYKDDYKSGLITKLENAQRNNETSEIKRYQDALDKYESAENTYRYKLYKQNAEEIFTAQDADGNSFGDELDFSETEFNYYVRVFNEIQEAGDYIGIGTFNGSLGGDAANDEDWLHQQLSSGKFSIASVTDNKNGKLSISTTSIATDSLVGETTTTTIDKTAYAKAEAEYEHDTKAIDAKDKKYDLELSKLETEREALKTEYDSVKKVASDNIERTFGIFS